MAGMKREYTSLPTGNWKVKVENYETGEVREIGDVVNIEFSITRERVPLYNIGNPTPRAYAQGRGGISGTLTWVGGWSPDMHHRVMIIPMPGCTIDCRTNFDNTVRRLGRECGA